MDSNEHDDAIPSYLSRLTRVPLLTPEEEVELTRAVQAGDQKARQRLVEANMRLVINIAKTYRSRAIPLEDLIQEGAIGLMQAAERFDPDKGFRFSTYATHWIRQAIGRAIDNKSKAIRLPAHVSQSLRRIEKERMRLARELGKDPTPDQIAAALGISSKKLTMLVQSSQELLSLDMTVGDSSGTTLGGLIRDNQNGDPETLVLNSEMVSELMRILSELNEREQKVMSMRFRLDDSADPKLQEDIAREMKLSRERIRQIEVQAIKKLRLLAQRRRLREMLG
ncbi:MAG: sigma-70 family RNA polymerase sigma factor [Fimbriimonadaceae bacterium]